MKAHDIMTRHVHTVTAETSVPTIARMLVEKGVSACPVVDSDHRVIGMVSEGDLFRRRDLRTERPRRWWHFFIEDADAMARAYRKTHGQLARDVMTQPVVSVGENDAVSAIADLFDKKHIKRVPVVRDGKLIGIVSRADLVRSLAGRPRPSSATASDHSIAEIVRARMAAEPWVSKDGINVEVAEGVVKLSGTAQSTEEKRSLRVLVEGVPGVAKVVDRLKVEPRIPTLLS